MWVDLSRKDGLDARRSVIEEDDTDYEHRGLVNMLAAIALLTIAICVVWTVKSIQEDERLEACFLSGRPDCMDVAELPRAPLLLSH